MHSLFKLLTFLFYHLPTLVLTEDQWIDPENNDSSVDVIRVVGLEDFILVGFLIQVLLDCSLVQSIFPILSPHEC